VCVGLNTQGRKDITKQKNVGDNAVLFVKSGRHVAIVALAEAPREEEENSE
jgi:hypothetical protein